MNDNKRSKTEEEESKTLNQIGGSSNRSGQNRKPQSRRQRRSSNSQNNIRSQSSKAGGKTKISRVIKGESFGNDISWHQPNSTMYGDVTQLPVTVPIGQPIRIRHLIPEVGDKYDFVDIISQGIMVSYFIPTLGQAVDGNSPVNIAATKLFQFLRKNKSGKETYQPADVSITFGALDSAYMFYEYICKIYGMMNYVDLMNWYTPETLVAAHGANYKDLKANLGNFKYYIDHYAYELEGFYVPKGFHLIDRHTFMTGQLFYDSDTASAQIYSFIPSHLWRYDEMDSSKPGSSLKLVQLLDPATQNARPVNVNNLYTLQQLIQLGDSLLTPLKESESIRNITSDILTVFSANDAYSVGEIPNNYKLAPVYDKKLLMMLENTYYYGGNSVSGTYEQHISIGKSYLKSTLKIGNDISNFPANMSKIKWEGIQADKYLLNFHWNNPSAEDIMYASRGAGFGFSTPDNGDYMAEQLLRTHGSEVFTHFAITNYIYQNHNPYLPKSVVSTIFNSLMFRETLRDTSAPSNLYENFNNVISVTNRLVQLSKFDWHPRVAFAHYMDLVEAGEARVQVSDQAMDLDVFIQITEEQLQMLNEVSLLGLLDIKAKVSEFAK